MATSSISQIAMFNIITKPKTKGYDTKMRMEISHYEKIFSKNNLSQSVPSIWNEVEKYFADMLEMKTGVRNLYQYVEKHVLHTKLKKIRILGLGSGACGNELDGIIPLLQNHSISCELTCIDINQQALNLAKSVANKRKIKFNSITSDINTVKIVPESYDVIVAYAALHHFVELDRLAQEIGRALKPDGIFVTVDIPTKNGYLMWPETFRVVNDIWKILPPKYKIDHTGFAKPKHIETYPNIDYSLNSFECINSEAILPALNKHLKCIDYVPSLSISRRFFDTKFGPNYNLENIFDRSIFQFITQLDSYYIENNILKPETFFGAYKIK